MKMSLRRAELRDMHNVFNLSNDPMVRANSIHTELIKWEDHKIWFEKQISCRDTKFYIAENSGHEFVGQVRFSHVANDWVVSISVAGKFRGRGIAIQLLSSAIERSGVYKFKAFIKRANIASRRLFVACGFVPRGEDVIAGNVYDVMERNDDKMFVIAEMSANHCGDKNLAKRIIAAAKECGVDAVKIQTYTADTMTIDCKNDYFKINNGSLWDGKYLYDLYKEASTPWEWQKELKEYADSIGIELFSTPFDKTATDFLEDIGVGRYKIASFEAVDIPLVKYVASKGKPMIVSVGICSLAEIQDIIDACKAVGNHDLTLLKCTSAYPAKLEDMNLVTMSDMIRRFGSQGVKIGLSDHSMNIETVIAGVALGAKVIEKHFTLDRNLGGADAAFSLNPDEMRAMVEAVRNTEKLLGKVDYSINLENRKFARSLFAIKEIKAGEVFTEENVRSIRPGYGLPPKQIEHVLGKLACRDISVGEPITTEEL